MIGIILLFKILAHKYEHIKSDIIEATFYLQNNMFQFCQFAQNMKLYNSNQANYWANQQKSDQQTQQAEH